MPSVACEHCNNKAYCRVCSPKNFCSSCDKVKWHCKHKHMYKSNITSKPDVSPEKRELAQTLSGLEDNFKVKRPKLIPLTIKDIQNTKNTQLEKEKKVDHRSPTTKDSNNSDHNGNHETESQRKEPSRSSPKEPSSIPKVLPQKAPPKKEIPIQPRKETAQITREKFYEIANPKSDVIPDLPHINLLTNKHDRLSCMIISSVLNLYNRYSTTEDQLNNWHDIIICDNEYLMFSKLLRKYTCLSGYTTVIGSQAYNKLLQIFEEDYLIYDNFKLVSKEIGEYLPLVYKPIDFSYLCIDFNINIQILINFVNRCRVQLLWLKCVNHRYNYQCCLRLIKETNLIIKEQVKIDGFIVYHMTVATLIPTIVL